MQIENEILLQIIVWLGSIMVVLLASLCGTIVYVYRTDKSEQEKKYEQYKSDNDCEHERIETAICEYRKEIREDINKIHNRIDRHLEDE